MTHSPLDNITIGPKAGLKKCPVCGSVQYWADRYHHRLHCAGCVMIPAEAMVAAVYEVPLHARAPKAVTWTEDDGRRITALVGRDLCGEPPPGMTWDEWFAGPTNRPEATGLLTRAQR